MRKLAATVDRYHAKRQHQAGGPTFGRKRAEVKAEREAPVLEHVPGLVSGVLIRLEQAAYEEQARRANRFMDQVRFLDLDKPMRDQAKVMFFGGMPIVPVRAPAGDYWALPPRPMRQAGPGPRWHPEDYILRLQVGCDLPPTDDLVELAAREVRATLTHRVWPSQEDPQLLFKNAHRRVRIKRLGETIEALHAVMNRRGPMLGKGASRAVYPLGKHTVLKVPCRASEDNIGANIRELRMWKKHRRRATVKLAACRRLMILGVPCLVMQRVHIPGKNKTKKGDEFSRTQSPAWAGRLDGYQCALTAGGEWVAYDYGYQREKGITDPLSAYEITCYERHTSRRMGQAAE